MLRMPEVAPTSLSAGTRGARTPREGESRTLTSLERRWRRITTREWTASRPPRGFQNCRQLKRFFIRLSLLGPSAAPAMQKPRPLNKPGKVPPEPEGRRWSGQVLSARMPAAWTAESRRAASSLRPARLPSARVCTATSPDVSTNMALYTTPKDRHEEARGRAAQASRTAGAGRRGRAREARTAGDGHLPGLPAGAGGASARLLCGRCSLALTRILLFITKTAFLKKRERKTSVRR